MELPRSIENLAVFSLHFDGGFNADINVGSGAAILYTPTKEIYA